MQKLLRQLGEWATKWRVNYIEDEFFIARVRLTFYYTVTAIVILGGSSILLYNAILSNLADSLAANIFLSPSVSQSILDRAQDILLNRFLTIDITIIFLIIILGFFLTNKTLKPIKISVQKQKRFIADASHELRTPTAVIISGLEVTLDNKKLDFMSAKKTLENTLDEMREFSKLSNNLLDISKYDSKTNIKHELLSINKLVRMVAEKSKILASVKNINFKIKIISKPIIIRGNEVELGRVLYNILDNAIKYTPVGGSIEISDKTSINKYILTITDTGIGIPAKIVPKIFDPFFREGASRTTDGAGLGLTLVKRIVDNHKGNITISSEVDKGTSIQISLPLAS
ncbi:MAG: HAMP domain-containing sensor histidine kinase [Candidatus Paceibacterota bacterium]|jgi:signal transduction histidine kinase